jgi:hypothetical protein
MEVGEKIYVESVLTDEDYRLCAIKYDYASGNKKPTFFNSDFKWRYKMGINLTTDEITIINKRMDAIRLMLKKEEEICT